MTLIGRGRIAYSAMSMSGGGRGRGGYSAVSMSVSWHGRVVTVRCLCL